MIKSLFGEDENSEKQEKSRSKKSSGTGIFDEILNEDIKEIETQEDVQTENTEVETPNDEIETIDEIKTAIESGSLPIQQVEETETATPKKIDTVRPFEVEKPIGQPTFERNIEETDQTESSKTSRASELERKLKELEEELRQEKELELQQLKAEVNERIEQETTTNIQQVEPLGEIETVVNPRPEQQTLFDESENFGDSMPANETEQVQVKPKDYDPITTGESLRNSGMAWSAAIAFFGSVVFMMIMGWIVDTLLGTRPWGIVGGIVIGATIGFIQFFRITSQIINPKPNDFQKVSISSENAAFTEEIILPAEENIEVVENELPTNEETETVENVFDEVEEKIEEVKSEIVEEENDDIILEIEDTDEELEKNTFEQ